MEGRVRSMRGLLIAYVLAAGSLAACGGGTAGGRPGSGNNSGLNGADGGVTSGNGGSGPGPVGTASPWTDLPQAEIALMGGSVSSGGGTAQAGGNAHVTSAGGISLDASLPQPPAPMMPASSGGTSLSSSALGSDVNASGGASLSGTVDSGGTDAVRKITASGDVIISGTLRGADLGGSRQGFDIEAPGHTVYVSGAIDTSGGSKGQSGGALTIVADQVVVSGKLMTTGGGGSSAGAAGPISIKVTSGASLVGTIDASGGDASGSGATAGARGGDLTITSGGDLLVAGTVRNRGGAAVASAGDAKGGDAGNVAIDCTGALTWPASLDGRGGPASSKSGGGTVAGGAAATLSIGQQTPPKAIAMLVPLSVAGGTGDAVGGDGGSAELDAKGGDLVIASTVDASGGGSAGQPGKGGAILAYPGSGSATANMDISGKVLANGGAASKGSGAVSGGAGGLIKLVQQSLAGNTTTEASATVQANGGDATGTGTAGGAGSVYLFTNDGNGTVHGQLQARGGDAPDPGGTGGGGGLVYVFTGAGHDRMSGVLIIAPDGTVDASGGDGTIGGSARNNGGGGVGLFPSNQNDEFDVEQIAVLINSDGVHGSDRGYLDNQGKVIARGGKANGNGGDVAYHGRQQDGNETPLPGDVENMGDGSGTPGDFAGE